MDKENLAIVALNMLPELLPRKILDLIDFFGGAYNVLQANEKDLQERFNFHNKTITKIKDLLDLSKASQELDTAHKNSIQVYTYLQKEYPQQLKNIYDYPPVLYVKGKLSPEDINSISVVGSRRPTNYGICATEQFCKYFAQHNITTISGLARGIDSCVHKSTIENGGKTIAVVGNGLLEYYPPENRKLQDEIYEKGAVISELSLNRVALPMNFPRRNRIIAGLSYATFVVECTNKSGTLITAELACEYNKDVFALPGQIYSKYSQGPNTLIQNGAMVALEPQDIIEQIPQLYKWCLTHKQTETKEVDLQKISKDGIKILKMLQSQANGLALDQISLKANIDIAQLSIILLELELGNYIKSMPGQVYVATLQNQLKK